ncbi:MAG TPA: flagellar assembly protein FliW [Chloroflexota bacterium]
MVAANESNVTMLPTDRRPVVFPGGLPGFPDLRRFHLVADPSFSPPFELLASEDDAAVAFYVIDPALIDSGYAPQMPPTDWAQIQAGPTDDVCLRVIITVGSDAQHTTANLAAPLVLNLTAGLGCQSILEDDSYSLRTPLIAHEG